MEIKKLSELPVSPNPHKVEAKQVYDTENATAVVITLKKGESLKRHKTPVDVFFYVLKGEGMVEIGDEQKEVSEDMIIDSPKDIPHRLINNDSDIFRVLVVKVPKPTTQTKLL
ncbi:cupin domain-containing protein [Methanoplanus limicola]|uniref:Cupin 2 conserved barrel domain protein n=1 Tax=Methanoplanus limicola DSM 2279 TaxID=937775 RepID=H1YY96_9EURY|nr:cupin domain-containing protein [Methanoplanus limicola]EHQ34191.1 Cupin 2 conserved barrel domain protein [Methanoplanus limicola DSM 2279]